MSETRRTVALLGADQLQGLLEAEGFETIPFDPSQSITKLRKSQPRLCVLGPQFQGNAAQGVRNLRNHHPFTDVLLWSPRADARQVRDVLLAGAKDVLLGADPSEVVQRVKQVVAGQTILPRVQQQDGRERHWEFEALITRSDRMWEVFETCKQTAATDATVLILGETGTGKDLIARAIHNRSGRSGRFVALNCAAVPETLLDSELFGHVKGAFTGATEEKRGLFREADGGTLFLDEIGNIPLPAQFRLLRALQEGTVRPVGDDREASVDTRVIAATSRRLDEAVLSGAFREDLLYRLDVIRISLPPLRERPEDIILLFEHFSRKLARQYQLSRLEIMDSFLDALLSYGWPGNVRQLENYAERLLLTHRKGKLSARSLHKMIPRSVKGVSTEGDERSSPLHVDLTKPLGEQIRQATTRMEREYLEGCLRDNGGRVGETAKQAGISRRTLLRKLKRHGIDKRAFHRIGGRHAG